MGYLPLVGYILVFTSRRLDYILCINPSLVNHATHGQVLHRDPADVDG